MSRPKNPKIAERNERIAKSWLEGTSPRELGVRTGLDDRSVRKIIKDELKRSGLNPKDRKSVPPAKVSLHERPSVSPVHVRLGSRVSCYRITELNMPLQEFATKVRVSGFRMSEIEAGVYDLKLGELIRIAEIMETEVHLLIYKDGAI